MPKGIYTGMLDVYVAKMTGTDSASSKPTYGAPQVLFWLGRKLLEFAGSLYDLYY